MVVQNEDYIELQIRIMMLAEEVLANSFPKYLADKIS